MPKSLKIVFIASECVPYAKTGGLADVVAALPGVLKKLGHEVIIVIPLYQVIDRSMFQIEPYLETLGVWMGGKVEWCSAHKAINEDDVVVYFIDFDNYFAREGLYHDVDFNDYLDNPRRFAFFSRAALQLCKDIKFKPDIIHTHDWHTAPACAYQKIWHWEDTTLGKAASVLTIHNVGYQGKYPVNHYSYTSFQWNNFTSDKFEDHGDVNFLKGGIYFSDIVTTVSPKYAQETRTPDGGLGMAPYLNNKGDRYIGILNGVDYSIWNPEIDTLIPANYSVKNLNGKSVCKRELQQRLSLEVNENIPLFGVVSRFADQKGLDLLAEGIDEILLNMRVQFVILGSGDKKLESFYNALPTRFPGRVSSYIGFQNELAHWIEAGSDFFVMPSRYEPCGLNQIYSLKYGTLPVVHATGGLDDTVEQYNEVNGGGTGFKFSEISTKAVYYSIGWAVSTFIDRPHHILQMQKKAMVQDFSWEKSAEHYLQAYKRAIRIHKALR